MGGEKEERWLKGIKKLNIKRGKFYIIGSVKNINKKMQVAKFISEKKT